MYCQMIVGRDGVTHGEGKNSWLTGTAAWTFTCISQYMLGIRPTFAGLCIDPCIPREWDGFTCERIYRGVKYVIMVDNRAHVEKGVCRMAVEGKEVKGNVIPYEKGKKEYVVEVTMG